METAITEEKHLFSPSVQLLGHKSEVYTAKFSPCGNLLASGGNDRQILLWDVFDPQCKNILALKGHSNSVLELCWSRDSSTLYSCGADRTLCMWNIAEGVRVKKYRDHENIVNSVDATKMGSEMIATASDDFTVKLWDPKEKIPILVNKVNYQATCVRFSENNEYVFFGGLDNQIKAWNIRTNTIEYSLIGHTDTVTGIALSNNGKMLLSNSVDHTVKSWDLRPFVAEGESRCLKTFMGGTHNFERNLLRCCWGPNDKYVSAGSADKNVYVWNHDNAVVWAKLLGHNGSVNETHFNPKHPIVASASSDHTVFLGEIAGLVA